MRKGFVIAAAAIVLLVVACLPSGGPTVTFSVPHNGDTLNHSIVTIKVKATDNGGVTKVEFYVDNTLKATDNTGTADTFQADWDATSATNGSHTIKAKAFNAADKTGEASITVFLGGAGPTHHSGKIPADETWWPSGNPHIIDSDVYTGDNITLTIKPGCVVQFSADAELYCGYSDPGSIVAAGKADTMITFTSLSDTVPGFWTGISFYGNTISTAKMSYCNVLFGGTTSEALGAVRVDATNIKFDHNLVRKSGSNGVWVSYTGYFSDFTNNTVTGCTRYAVHVGAANVPTLGAGNTLTGNTKNGIEVFHSAVTTSGTWLNHGVPYVVTDDVVIDQNAVVTISAGCTIAGETGVQFYCGYSSPGGIIADGTAGQITFTSSVNPPSAGDWSGLTFYGNSVNSQCKLINCKVEYGGYDSYGNIRIDNCTPTVTGCDIGYSSAWGIYLSGSEYPVPADLLANNTFHNNTSGNIRVPPTN